jgi:cytochrome P450
LKYLVHNQHAQKKLRDALHSSYPDARKQSRRPTLEEILRTNIPYVDAVIDETLRCAWVLPLIMRQALVDTQILGKPIPKGTTLVLFGMGPGLTMPALKLDDEESQKSVEAFRNKVGSFDENNMDEFLPERWLKTTVNKSGQEETVFNANAGPTMGFGHGPRSCFGRRMATAEIKIFLTLVIWSFEMLPLGPKLWNMDESLGLTRHPKDVNLKLRRCT